jgi:hypothetical protein
LLALIQGALGRSAAAFKLGRHQQAAAEARLAQSLRPGDVRGAVAEGLAYMAGRDHPAALLCLKRARDIETGYPGAAGRCAQQFVAESTIEACCYASDVSCAFLIARLGWRSRSQGSTGQLVGLSHSTFADPATGTVAWWCRRGAGLDRLAAVLVEVNRRRLKARRLEAPEGQSSGELPACMLLELLLSWHWSPGAKSTGPFFALSQL